MSAIGQAVTSIKQRVQALLSGKRSGLSKEEEMLKEALSEDNPDEFKLPLAYAFLLVDLALVDHQFHKREYAIIFKKLEQILGLSEEEIRNLIDHASSLIGAQRSSSAYAEYLREKLSSEKRQELMGVIEEMIAADGREEGFELYLRERYSELLGLSEGK